MKKDQSKRVLKYYASLSKEEKASKSKLMIESRHKYDTNDYINRVYELYGDSLKVVGKYNSCDEYIKHICKKCNFIWNAKSSYIKYRVPSCPNCKKLKKGGD